MSVLICKMCGGDLEIKEGMTTARCPYCGTNQTLPKLDNEQRLRLYDRANHFRRNNDYDKAMAVYEQILNEDQTDSEAYWSIVLCRYGIEYVEDPSTRRRIPTVNRMQYTSVLADEDYKAALRYADVVQARIYEQEAIAIDAIQKGIFQVSRQEAPYDIFICYKEADEDGNRTRDSVLADEIYYQLIRNGFRVFFARITLQDKPGVAYEPYIFAALHSARAMIVVGTSPENFQTVWVRNEWSRYLTLIKQGEDKVLIPAYRDMDPYDLPKEFSHLQALDMSRLGFIQDLIHGIKNILGETVVQSDAKEPVKPDYISLTGAEKINYEISEDNVRKTGWGPYGWKWGVALGIFFVLGILLINSKGLYQRWKMDHEGNTDITEQTKEAGETFVHSDIPRNHNLSQEEQEDGKLVFTGLLEKFVSRVYQCPANDVSDSQLGKIQQLVITNYSGLWQIGYSFEAPTGDMFKYSQEDLENQFGEEFVWTTFSIEEDLDLSSLRRFSNLKKLDVEDVITAKDISGLPLESVSAYFDDPAAAAAVLENPGAVRELGFNAGGDSLNGIELFENLEALYIDYSELDNLDALIHVGNLKKLTLGYNENLTDFTVLEKLPELEKIALGAEGLKTLDFVGKLKHLDTIKIERGKLKSLSGLENCSTLTSLSIIDCIELKDMSAVAELVNLQELVLDVPYGCPEPKLDKLTQIRKLSLDQFQDFSFLQNMSDLTELHLKSCKLPKGMDFSNLSSLKILSCTSYVGSSLDVNAIEAFKMLECLDLHGTETYDDISGIFNMPNLKELNISGMQCEIDFDAITENSTLEVLRMDDMYLYENVWVEYNSGITIADWDEVIMDEHMDFLKKFPGLRELYLAENGLTDISFAEALSALEILDISDNYITQLRPLAELPSLRRVICPDNPLRNEKVLKDSVLIIKDAGTE